MATDGKINRWNGVAYPAVDERLLDSPLLMPGPSAEPFSARSGRRVNGAGLVVSIGTGPDSWTVTGGAGVIYDSTYAAQGAWRFEIPASISGNFPARPGAGQSRIDLIVARIYDSDIPVGAVKEVKIERVPGTAGASPSAPALPALSLLLGTVTVPDSGAMTLNAATARTVAAGGILPVSTTAERDALPNPWRGLVVDNGQTGKLERYDGTNWKTLVEVPAAVTFTPTWSNVTLGTGATNTGKYFTDSSGLVTVKFNLILGAGGLFTTSPLLQTPVTLADSDSKLPVGTILMNDSGGTTTRRAGIAYQIGTNTIGFLITGNTTGDKRVQSDSPWTWGNTDQLTGTIVIEPA